MQPATPHPPSTTQAREPSVPRTAWAYFCHFMVSGLVSPFICTVLSDLGYTHAQIGFTLAISSVWTIVMPVFVGRLVDQRVPTERVIRCCVVATCLLALGLWAERKDALAFVVVLFMFYGTRAPVASLLDTLATRAAGRRGGVYGKMRLLGSVGFVVSATAAGWVMSDRIEDRFFPALLILVGLAAVANFALPRTRPPEGHTDEPPGAWYAQPGRAFWLWLGAMMLHWFCFAPYQYGFTLFLQEQQVPARLVGVVWSVGAVAEMAAFLTCGWFFKRMSVTQVLALALASSLLRWGLLGLFPGPGMIVATQLLHGPSFGLYYAAAMQQLGTFAAPRMHASLQGLFATCVNGFAYCAGTMTAGLLHNAMPLDRVMLCMLPAECLALGLLVASERSRMLAAQPLSAPVPVAALQPVNMLRVVHTRDGSESVNRPYFT